MAGGTLELGGFTRRIWGGGGGAGGGQDEATHREPTRVDANSRECITSGRSETRMELCSISLQSCIAPTDGWQVTYAHWLVKHNGMYVCCRAQDSGRTAVQ